jgi:hypothetical protein
MLAFGHRLRRLTALTEAASQHLCYHEINGKFRASF